MWTLFATSFVLALSGAMMPGPLLTVTITESARVGWRAGPMLIAGHAILEAILVAAVLCGLAPWLQGGLVFASISVLGAVILLWMATGMLNGLSQLKLPVAECEIPADARNGKMHAIAAFRLRLMGAGILLSLMNPYWILWWVTVGLGYIISAQLLGATGVLVFFTGHILADLAWYSLVSAAIDQGKRWISDRSYRIMVALCALFLVGTALWLGYGGIAGFTGA